MASGQALETRGFTAVTEPGSGLWSWSPWAQSGTSGGLVHTSRAFGEPLGSQGTPPQRCPPRLLRRPLGSRHCALASSAPPRPSFRAAQGASAHVALFVSPSRLRYTVFLSFQQNTSL